MTAYSNSDAARDLRPALDKAPAGAVKGEWFFITEQAGVSSQSGGYFSTNGSYVAADNHAFERIREVVEKLEASGIQPFNKVIFSPMSRIILSRDSRRIEGLPFGSVPLIRVTPIAEAEIAHQDQSDEWAANAAKHVLAERRIKT